ncbi:MAG: SLBB domain-containing protein [Candidatus Omnitrophica bacterium]|nr:SLBB domain-containing protein [Candidatus Omnitrophota bacterium]
MNKIFLFFIFSSLFFLPSPSRGADGRAEYRIFPRDILEIRVYDNPDLTQRLEVSESGEISFPLIGKVKVVGLTTPEAEQSLGKSLSEYIVNPQVAVLVAQRQKIYVSGEVSIPGAYELTAGMTVMEAIALAGGFKVQELNQQDQTIIIRGAEIIPVKISEISLKGDKSKNIFLKPNDLIVAPQRQKIYVSGEVKKPGAYELTVGMNVFEAITLAGGFTDFAAPNKTSVRRTKGDKKEAIVVPISEILKRGDKKKDITLEPGDVIIVPETFF